MLLLGVPVLLFYYFHRKKLKSKGKILQTLLSDEIKTVSQSLGSIKETKLLNKEYYFLSYFNKLIQNKENLIFFHYMVTSSSRLFLESISLFSIAIISTFLIFSERSSESILPLISLYAVSAVRFIPALNVITSSLTTIRFRQPSFDLLVKEIKNLG